MESLRTDVNPRYLSLDVWRGLACLMVVVDHVAIPAMFEGDVKADLVGWEGALRQLIYSVTRLGFGPAMFFVISGYCIAASLDSLRRKGKSAGDFERRRLWRTYPPYWVALGLYVVVTAGLDRFGLGGYHGGGPCGYGIRAPSELTWQQWLGNLTLTETWRHMYVGPREAEIFTRIAWSLCYQEQFYFVCFLVVLLWPRKLFRRLMVVSGLIILVQLALWDTGWFVHAEGLFPNYWHEFAVGLVVYWRLNMAKVTWQRRAVDLGLVGMLILGFVCEDLDRAYVAAAFGLLLIAVRPWDKALADTRWLMPIRACGKRCYSIYLIHMLVCCIAATVIWNLGARGFWMRVTVLIPSVIALSIASGWVFYALVESHFLPASRRSPMAAPVRIRPEVAVPAPRPSLPGVAA